MVVFEGLFERDKTRLPMIQVFEAIYLRDLLMRFSSHLRSTTISSRFSNKMWSLLACSQTGFGGLKAQVLREQLYLGWKLEGVGCHASANPHTKIDFPASHHKLLWVFYSILGDFDFLLRFNSSHSTFTCYAIFEAFWHSRDSFIDEFLRG